MSLFCKVRKESVAALPEEIVRQSLLNHLIQDLNFPIAHLAVEKSLKQMPHLTLRDQAIPKRRADIICFAPGIHSEHTLYPLLLIECKAVKLHKKAIRQLIGYNHHVKAYFIAAANQEEIAFGWYDKNQNDYVFIPHIPPYEQLLQSISAIVQIPNFESRSV